MREGYYPYFLQGNYILRLNNVINTVLEQDIPRFAELSLALSEKLKKLLYIIAQSVPFKPNYSKIAEEIGTNRNVVAGLMVWLERGGVINILRDSTHGIRALGKVEKIYLSNPNLTYALSDTEPDIGNVRETIFFAWLKTKQNITSSKTSDFEAGKYTFEIGGKKKGQRQIQDTPNAYLVKDDIEYAYQNELPLWAFGLIY